MHHNSPKEINWPTAKGEVRIRSFCTPEEIRNYSFDGQFGTHAHYKSLYTRRESLEKNAVQPDTNVVLALAGDKQIIGFGVLADPDPGERWAGLGPGMMIEVKALEVSRSWRAGGIASGIIRMMLAHPRIEDKICYLVGYSWTWDLDKTKLRAQEYRQILIKLFEPHGFQEYQTNEPNICLKAENIFMARIGKNVSIEMRNNFKWLRFGIAPETRPAAAVIKKEDEEIKLKQSLFLPLQKENLTTLGIYYDYKSGRVSLRASREWEANIDWRRYARDFSVEHPLTADTIYLGSRDTRDLFKKHSLGGYLDDVIDLIKKGKHQGIECLFDRKLSVRFINNMHSNTLGRNNKYHAIRGGGIRRHETEADEIDVIIDGLNLSRDMSFKNAGAQIPFGGSYLTVQSKPVDYSDHSVIGFLAYAIDRTRSFTGPDMGFSPALADVMRREEYSINISGGYGSKIGPTGAPTAYGVYLALKEAAYYKFGTLNLAGKKIVVQGIGAVGYPLVEKYLSKEDASIFVADIATEPVEKITARFAGRVHRIDPKDVYNVDADIFVPCAMGGVIDENIIKGLKYSIVLGGANNPLKATDQEGEIRLARLLDQRGILFQIDWMHNTAGVIAGMEEYLNQENASLDNIMGHIEKVCRDGVRENLKAARNMAMTPTEQAYRHYSAIIYR